MLQKYHGDDLLHLYATYETQNAHTPVMQEHWEYDLTTNSVKLMQQMSLPVSEGDSSVFS